jgi:hypothetical protein
MDANSQVKHLSRIYLQLGSYIFKQVDPSVKLRINPHKFMECIEYQDSTGQVLSPPNWCGAPENLEDLKEQLLAWISHSEERSSVIPSLHNQDWEIVRKKIEEGGLGLPRMVRPGVSNCVLGNIIKLLIINALFID